MGLFHVDLNNVSHDDNDFDAYDSETITHARFMTWSNRLSNARHVKKT